VTEGGEEPSEGLASLVSRLLETNLERDPSRRRLLREAVVVLEASDAAAVATLEFREGRFEVRDGGHPRPTVSIRATGIQLLELAGAPLRWGLPDPIAPQGRAVLGAIVWRDIRIHRLLTGLPTLRRLTMLLSVR
jgi:hypothetical protein